MRPFKISKGSFYTMNMLMIKLVVWLGWLSCVAVGQLELSEAVTGFVNFPEVGISCIGNLAVLITSISKGRLDLEMGVRDVLASTRGPILKNINGIETGLTTCEDQDQASVLMLSYNTNSSTKDFMKYISNAHKVHSILLECLPFKSVPKIGAQIYNCNNSPEHEPEHKCKCIVIKSSVGQITDLLRSEMEKITNLLRSEVEVITNLRRSEMEEITNLLKPFSDSQCLLPSAGCLRNGCHIVGNEGTLKVDAACEILEMVEDSVQKMHTCICIPLKAAADDNWTKLLTKSFRSKDTEERRVSVMASDAMEIYTTQDANNTYRARKKRKWLRKGLRVEFNSTSLILPRLTEILINFLLVGWFKVDGFSSSMVARKAVKKYVVGSEKSGFAANAFLSRALVKSEKCDDNNATHVRHVRHVCQVLTFRPCFLRLRCLSYLAGTINLLCAAFWAVFIGIERYKWYAKSEVPSKPRVVVIIVAISFALVMDCWHLYLVIPDKIQKAVTEIKSNQTPQTTGQVTKGRFPRKIVTVFAVILCIVSGGAVFAVIVEILCIVSGGVGLVWGKIVFGKWVYSAVQALVWVKWGIGSYLLGESFGESSSAEGSNRAYNWGGGVLVYSSAFFLNSVLAGVRCEWKYLPSGSDSPANSPTMSPPG